MEFPLFSGILAAVLHVISGPDHLAAVTPFALEGKRKSWRIGATWGVAHLCGMLLIGVLFLVFRELIPVDAISAYSEQLVGLVLVLVGIWTLYTVFRSGGKHTHLHIHQDGKPYMHKHPHRHGQGPADRVVSRVTEGHGHFHSQRPRNRGLATFSIGFLHGLAGIAHFLLFLPVLGFDRQADSLAYIGGFGIGTILAMAVFTLVLGRVSELAGNWHHPLFFKGIRIAGGLFALIIGIYWILVH